MTGQACPLRLVPRYEARGYRSVRLSFGARRTAKDLDGHPKVAQGVEVGDVNPAVLTAEHHAVLALCPRDGLVEVRGGDGDVVHALALLGEEAGIDAFLVERLDELPPGRPWRWRCGWSARLALRTRGSRSRPRGLSGRTATGRSRSRLRTSVPSPPDRARRSPAASSR